MEIEKFLSFVRNAKRTNILSGYSNFKVWRKENVYEILNKQVCKSCGSVRKERLFISFKKLQSLTIFQCDLLFYLFVRNQLIRDYANYHKCEAGKKFIENIERIEVITT